MNQDEEFKENARIEQDGAAVAELSDYGDFPHKNRECGSLNLPLTANILPVIRVNPR